MRIKNLTSNAPADRLLSEKLSGLKTFPGPGGFDCQGAWDRLGLPQTGRIRKIRWLTAAAVLCVLVGTSIWFYASGPRPKSFVPQDKLAVTADPQAKPPKQTPVSPVIQKTDQRSHPSERPQRSTPKASHTSTPDPEIAPEIPPPDTASDLAKTDLNRLPAKSPASAADTAVRPSLVQASSPDKNPEAVSTPPIVYYQAIAAAREQPPHMRRTHTPVVISLRPETTGKPIAAQQSSGAERIKINLSR